MKEAAVFENFAHADFEGIDFAGVSKDVLGLDLSFTGIRGAGLRKVVEMFPNLVALYLQGARLKGEDLFCLTGLKNLKELNLCDAILPAETLRPLSVVGALETLCLSRIDISDADVEQLVGLALVSRLDLSHNRDISDRVLEILPRMPKLVDVDLSWTQITRDGLSRATWGRPIQIYVTGTRAG